MGNYRIITVTGVIALAVISCKRDMPPDPVEPVHAVYAPGEGVFVTNEGNFTWGNSSISYFSFDSQLQVLDAFEDANGIPLGDVCQSMTVIGNRGYIVVNNSGKIVVVNMSDFAVQTTITGFSSPRYMIPVSATKAYVSDLYGDGISIVDLATNTITGEVFIPGWTERMLFSNGKLYVTCAERNQLYVVDPVVDVVTDSITVTTGGNSLSLDAAGKLWVLCSGDYVTSVPGALYRIDTVTNVVEWSGTFPNGHYPMNMVMNTAGTELYFLDGSIYNIQTSTSGLPVSPFIPANGRNFYGLGISPTGNIYVADARDYVLPGWIYKYTSSVVTDSMRVGISPGNFCFY